MLRFEQPVENYRRSFPSRCFDRKSARRVSFFTFGFYQSTVPNVIASRKHSFLKTLPFERKKKKKKELIFIDNSRVGTTRFSINNRSKNICAIVFLSLFLFANARKFFPSPRKILLLPGKPNSTRSRVESRGKEGVLDEST